MTGMTATAELAVDQILAGTYRIERLLGRGGMGAVYQAEHLRTHKQVALKILRPGFGKIREVAKRFEREALTTSLLSHPGVVQVDDYGELEDGVLFLVMELIPGASLREIIDDGPVPPAQAFAITRQVLDALAHAHALGVIHRDLKPDNVKVIPDQDREGGRVKILDFGIAKVVGMAEEMVGDEKLTQAGIAFGTPDYMAPEQALGQAVDARADLYSLGVILFEMLAGRRPFVADEPVAVARMHVAVPAPTLASVLPRAWSHETEALLARALAKRSAERFNDALDMSAALEVAAAAEGVPLGGDASGVLPALPLRPASEAGAPLGRPPSARPGWLARRSRRERTIAGVAAASLALVLAVVALPGGPESKGPRGAGRGSVPMAVPRSLVPMTQTPLAKEALALVDAGKAAEARSKLEAGLRAPGGERDASAHLALGATLEALDQPLEALSAYELGVAIEPGAAKDERAQKAVLALASQGKSFKVRQRAAAVAERFGIEDRIDRFEAASADLVQAPSCPERREAVLVLRQLKDARAVPLLKKARNRRTGWFGTGRPNSCLEKDAADAIADLEE
jgi:eukaryotic-like serine/threonine-protein kinase